MKVIGIHRGSYPNIEKHRNAILIKKAINQFIEELSKKNNINYNSPYSYLDTIDIIYSLPSDKSDNRIKIFGTEFVERYEGICKIIYKGEEKPLSEYFPLTTADIQNKEFRIKLKGVNYITDASYMFRSVNNLFDVPNISRMDVKNIKSMEVMFEGCKELKELKGINRWNVENVVSMRGMFYNCSKLQYLPNIDEWNPINLNNCYQMFYGCESLSNSEVSKIEKWKNVNKNVIEEAFNGHELGFQPNYYLHGFWEYIRTFF